LAEIGVESVSWVPICIFLPAVEIVKDSGNDDDETTDMGLRPHRAVVYIRGSAFVLDEKYDDIVILVTSVEQEEVFPMITPHE
jgi:hypothetical protein